MPNFSLLDKKYPYYVRYKAISAWLLKTGLLAAVHTLQFLLTTDHQKKEKRAIGANAPYTAVVYSPCGYPTAFNRLAVSYG